MIAVEKRGHPSIWILPAHLISLGKPQRCLVRTVAKAWPSLANREWSYSLNSVSPLRLGKIDRAMRYLGGATLLFRWEVGVLASRLVHGMIEFAGAQAG